MSYFKIINNNVVIDVSNICFKTQKKPHVLLNCSISECEYIPSYNGEVLFYSDWTAIPKYPFKAEYARIEEIEKEEYLQLVDQLKADKKIEYIDKEQLEEIEIITPIEEEQQIEVLDTIAMKRKILELEELVQKLLNK